MDFPNAEDENNEELDITDINDYNFTNILDGGITLMIKYNNWKFQLNTRRIETIRNIKIQIENENEIILDWDKQILSYNDIILQDDNYVAYYGIGHLSEIKLRLRGGITVIIDYNNWKFTLDTSKIETIQNIKVQIENEIGLDRNKQILSYNGTTLNDENSCDFYGIGDLSEIKLKEEITLFIIYDYTKYKLNIVSKNETIKDIKLKIEDKIGLDRNNQILSYNCMILKDEDSVDYYGIEDLSELNVKLCSGNLSGRNLYLNSGNLSERNHYLSSDYALERNVNFRIGNLSERNLYLGYNIGNLSERNPYLRQNTTDQFSYKKLFFWIWVFFFIFIIFLPVNQIPYYWRYA